MDSLSTQSTQKLPIPVIGSSDRTPGNQTIPDTPSSPQSTSSALKASWTAWYSALKSVLPVYIIIHVVFFVISCLAILFQVQDLSKQALSISTLWQNWLQWDTINFRAIAVNGYNPSWLAAFFPLYPLLERCLTYVTHDSLIAGLTIADISGLGMLVVLFRLVQEDFHAEHAFRTVLYLSVFPTAFFFAAAYSESLFLFLALLSFYHIRQGHWWLAGLAGFLAALTRVSGLFLLLPFFYEYLRQHMGNRKISPLNILRAIRLDSISGLCIAGGVGVYALYCYIYLHDVLAFSHAEVHWNRQMSIPGYELLRTIHAILISQGFLSFLSLRNLLDLVLDLFILVLVGLGFVGPWKFPRHLSVYAIYAATFFLFPHIFPVGGLYPLESIPRYMLATFPAFIVLAQIGKNRTVDAGYLLISGSVLFFLLIQFLTGHWIT